MRRRGIRRVAAAVAPTAVVLVSGLLALLGGCAEAGTGPVLAARTVTLAPADGGGVVGTATVTPESGATSSVTVRLRGAAAGAWFAGAIHAGSCADPGPVAAALRGAHGGAGEAIAVTTGVPDLVLGPGYSLRYAATGGDGGWPAAVCGDITATAPPPDPGGDPYR